MCSVPDIFTKEILKDYAMIYHENWLFFELNSKVRRQCKAVAVQKQVSLSYIPVNKTEKKPEHSCG
jgi:hypothetical protein